MINVFGSREIKLYVTRIYFMIDICVCNNNKIIILYLNRCKVAARYRVLINVCDHNNISVSGFRTKYNKNYANCERNLKWWHMNCGHKYTTEVYSIYSIVLTEGVRARMRQFHLFFFFLSKIVVLVVFDWEKFD